MANKPTEVTTGEVRISYEHLMKPYAPKPDAEPKYSATLLIPKTDIDTKRRIDAAIQAAIAEGVSSKWGGIRPPQPPIPIHDGDGLRPNGIAFGPECKGHWVMTASSKQPQEIVDIAMNPIINPTEVYSGMYARVNINFFAYNQAGRRGIGCGLGPVQKTRDGEPLGGRTTAAEVFGSMPQQPYVPAPQYPQQQTDTPPWQTPAQPQYAPSQTQAPAQQSQINPITGQPYGGVMGL
ncbi:MAG: ssDNA-binding protein [Bacillota bacterium]